MDKRYQVFVSSTYDDLREERQEIMQALLELDCIPSGMELFPAANDDQWTLIKKVIDDSDYYLVIIGGRYGSTNKDGKSFTQMEYEYAISKGKPTIAFLHGNPGTIAANKTESTDEGKKKLAAFRDLAKQKMVKFWSSPKDLGSVVSRSIVKLMKSHPAIGWIRANESIPGPAAQEMLRLREKIDSLESELQANATRPPRGSESLAKPEEFIELHFTTTPPCTISLTWKNVFGCVLPMILEAGKAKRATIEQRLVEYCHKEILQITGSVLASVYIHMVPESLDTVLAQLRALDLITKQEEKNFNGDRQTYWILTPYGDTFLTRLMAVPSKLPPNSPG